MAESKPALVILHWNDAYQIESQTKEEPVGGASKFVSKCQEIKTQYPDSKVMITCAGDVFNPSMLSVVHKGKQMLPIFEALGLFRFFYSFFIFFFILIFVVSLFFFTQFFFFFSSSLIVLSLFLCFLSYCSFSYSSFFFSFSENRS